MIIPFVIRLLHNKMNLYNTEPVWGDVCAYYCYHCCRNKWPIIAEKALLESADANFAKNPGARNAFWGICNPHNDEISQLDRYVVPQDLLDNLVEEKGSLFAASVFLQKERYQPLEEVIECFIRDIQSKYEEPIDAFIAFELQTESMRYLAQKYNIRLLGWMLGALRPPTYMNTAYLCQGDIMGSDECERRYNEFCREIPGDYPLFDNRELLSLVLSKEYHYYLRLLEITPQHKMLLAGGYAASPCLSSFTEYSDLEALSELRTIYGFDFRFRQHPGDPNYASYQMPDTLYDDASKGFLAILNAERVASNNGSMLFEAMLWGRTACAKVKLHPVSFMCQRDFKPKEKPQIPIAFLNFYCFCMQIPYELTMDPTYLRWRFSGPTEREIFEYNLQFFLSKIGLDISVFHRPKAERLNAILTAKGAENDCMEALGEIVPTCPISTLHYNGNQIHCLNRAEGQVIISQFSFTCPEKTEEVSFSPILNGMYLYTLLEATVNNETIETGTFWRSDADVKLPVRTGEVSKIEVRWKIDNFSYPSDACSISRKVENIRQESEGIKSESERTRRESERIKNESEQTRQESERIKSESERTRQESERLKSESERTRQESERLKSESERTRQESERLKSELNGLREQLDLILNSTSWKITKPVRAARAWIKRL